MTDVNIQNMTLFVEALRSGEYVQTKGALHLLGGDVNGDSGWCCLGVAADLAAKNDLTILRSTVGQHEMLDIGQHEMLDNSATQLGPKVAAWLGLFFDLDNALDARPPHNLTNPSGGFDYFQLGVGWAPHNSLVYCNDEQGLTFPEIADVVERIWLNPAIQAQVSKETD